MYVYYIHVHTIMYHQSIVSTRLPCLVWFRSFRWMSLGESPARGLAKALSRQGWDHDTSKMYWLWSVDDCFGLLGWCSTTFHLVFSHRVLMLMDIFNQPYDLYGLEGLKWWLSTTFEAIKSFGTCLHFRPCVDTSPERAVRGQPTQTVSWHILAEYGWVLPTSKMQQSGRWGQGGWLLILNPVFFFACFYKFCLRPMWCPCLQPWACRQTGHARWGRGQLHQSWGYLCSRESYVWHLAKLSWGAPGCIILCFTSHLSERPTA